MCVSVIITNKVLTTALMAEEQQHVFVIADWPEIRDSVILTRFCTVIALDEFADVVPTFKVLTSEKVIDTFAVDTSLAVLEYT